MGVYLHKMLSAKRKHNVFCAYKGHGRKRIHLGYYLFEDDARLAEKAGCHQPLLAMLRKLRSDKKPPKKLKNGIIAPLYDLSRPIDKLHVILSRKYV